MSMPNCKVFACRRGLEEQLQRHHFHNEAAESSQDFVMGSHSSHQKSIAWKANLSVICPQPAGLVIAVRIDLRRFFHRTQESLPKTLTAPIPSLRQGAVQRLAVIF